MEICYRARSYFIEKIEQETEEALAERAWFVIKILDPSTGIDRSSVNESTTDIKSFDEAVLLSKYWYYVKKYDCRYSPNIMKKLENAEKLFYV